MPIFLKDSLRVLFVHVPKTGGTAVEAFFKQNGFQIELLQRPGDPMIPFRRCSPQHMHAALLKETLRLEKFDYIFMTVRHPIARMVSEYGMRQKDKSQRSPEDFASWMHGALDTYPTQPFAFDNHIRPQADFFLNGADVFKQEDRYDLKWVETLSRRLGTPLKAPKGFGERRPNSHAGQAFAVPPDLEARMRDFYAEDFERFSYAD